MFVAAPLLLSAPGAVTLHASLDGGRNLTLRATLIQGDLPSLPLNLLLARCAPETSAPQRGPFALLARHGGCPLKDKMRTAITVGAAALLIGDTLTSRYANAAMNASVSSIGLADPCLVSCHAGRGIVDTRGLAMADVLAGMPGRCPAPDTHPLSTCPTQLCAFSSAPNGTAVREVCCVLGQQALATGLPDAVASLSSSTELPSSASLLPVLVLPLAHGQALDAACVGLATTGSDSSPQLSSPCEIRLHQTPPPPAVWDRSSLLIWILATATAALASLLAANELHAKSAAVKVFEEPGGGTDQLLSTSPGGLQGRIGSDGGIGMQEQDTATLDGDTAVVFLLMACTGLVTLYFLIKVVTACHLNPPHASLTHAPNPPHATSRMHPVDPCPSPPHPNISRHHPSPPSTPHPTDAPPASIRRESRLSISSSSPSPSLHPQPQPSSSPLLHLPPSCHRP